MFYSCLNSYYRSFPEGKQTILTYLMQLFMIICCTGLLHITLTSIIVSTMPETVQSLLDKYPALICSICSLHGYTLAGLCLISILIFMIFLQVKPLQFLEMNHEKLCTVVYSTIFIVFMSEIVLLLYQQKTLCFKQKLWEFKVIYNFNVDLQSFKFTVPLTPLNGVIALFLEIIFLILKFKKWFYQQRSRNQVHPVVQVMIF